MATITLTGISGTKYEYEVCDVNAQWLNVPGNYAMVDANGGLKYIGETNNFATRRPGPSHEKWAEAQRYGATYVIAHLNEGGEAARKAEETDLIRAYNPPANNRGLRSIFATEGLGGQPRRTTILTRP